MPTINIDNEVFLKLHHELTNAYDISLSKYRRTMAKDNACVITKKLVSDIRIETSPIEYVDEGDFPTIPAWPSPIEDVMKTATKLGFKCQKASETDHINCLKIFPNEPYKVKRNQFYLLDVDNGQWKANNMKGWGGADEDLIEFLEKRVVPPPPFIKAK
jgi:hypothetical protein